MFKNYFKTTFRSLWNNKGYSGKPTKITIFILAENQLNHLQIFNFIDFIDNIPKNCLPDCFYTYDNFL